MASNSKTIFKRFLAMEKIGHTIDVPWHFGRFFNSKELSLLGSDLCMAEEADYGSIQECRQAVEFYVEQLGGKVTWS